MTTGRRGECEGLDAKLGSDGVAASGGGGGGGGGYSEGGGGRRAPPRRHGRSEWVVLW